MASALIAVGALSTPAFAQIQRDQTVNVPSNPPVQVGPVAFAPVVELANLGYDSNVFNLSSQASPQSDTTATFTPMLDAWLTSRHAIMRGRSRFNYAYFKDLTYLRAVDSENTGHVDFILNRLLPYFDGSITSSRHQQSLEIDALVRQRGHRLSVGTGLRLTENISVEGFYERSKVEFDANSIFLSTDLSRAFNHTTRTQGAAIAWALTPYTTFSIVGTQDKDRFVYAVDRNSDSVEVSPMITFKPLALVSGRASVGFRRRRFLTSGVPDFKGTVALVNLNYTFREGTQFSADLRRELQYSYLASIRDYVNTDLTGTVRQRLGDFWDVSVIVERGHLGYGVDEVSAAAGVVAPSDERILLVGGEVGYKLGRTRVSLRADHSSRRTDRTDITGRAYDRSRVYSTITYAFQ